MYVQDYQHSMLTLRFSIIMQGNLESDSHTDQQDDINHPEPCSEGEWGPRLELYGYELGVWAT
jgi:hypothetical protein